MRPPISKKAINQIDLTTNWRFWTEWGSQVSFLDQRAGEMKFEIGRDFSDFLVWRKEGIASYELATVVDDHLMQISEVVRGEDLLISSARQCLLFEALGWSTPSFYHCKLLYGSDGKKLSKRDKASTLDDYSKIGIMPDALRNYLLRLGWSYQDKEIFTLDESIKYFNLEGIGKSPSKLDMSRILSMNEHYIKNINENDLFKRTIIV